MPEKTVMLDRKVPAFCAAASGGRKWQLADAATIQLNVRVGKAQGLQAGVIGRGPVEVEQAAVGCWLLSLEMPGGAGAGT